MLTRFAVFAGAALSALALTTPARANEPVARFFDEVCPGVAGLQLESAAAVVGRMRANAEEFGLRLAPDGACDANVLVVFVEDGQAVLSQLRNQRGYMFSELSRAERDALLAAPGPARVFLRTRDYGRDGMPVYRRDNLTEIPQTRMWMAHSKIYSATRRDIHNVLVLFDRAGVNELTLNQLADYASLRAFAQLRPRAAEGPTIASLFEPGVDRSDGLTERDRAFLTALYRGIPNMPAKARMAELALAAGGPVAE